MLSVSVNVYGSSSILGPTSYIQRWLVGLEDTVKMQVLEEMGQIEKIQKEQKLVSNFLGTARQLQNESKENQDQTSRMPDDMYAYINENNLGYDKSGDAMLLTAEEWDPVLVLLENRLRELSMKTQQKMVYVQNLMGQNNSHPQGSNKQNQPLPVFQGCRVCTAILRSDLPLPLWYSDLFWDVS